MATRSFVPQASGEGGLGTTLKHWLQSYIRTLYTDNIREITSANGVNVDGITLKDGVATVITGGTNTFDITNGTASLNVAAGSTLDVNADLTVSSTTVLTGTPYTPAGTDVAIADGGTGASTAATAFNNLKQNSSAVYAGVVELATVDEVIAGLDENRVVTPATLVSKLSSASSISCSEFYMTTAPTSGYLLMCDTVGKGTWVSVSDIPAGTKMYFYQNTAPVGWTIDNAITDGLLAIKGGAAAYNANGGTAQGTWSPTGHTHTGPSHTHTGPSHTHTMGNHTHTGPSHTHTGPSHTHSVSAHTHTMGNHTHTGPSHTHTGPSHTHTGPSHTHTGPSHRHSSSDIGGHYHVVGDHSHTAPSHTHDTPSHTHTTGDFTLTTSHMPAHSHKLPQQLSLYHNANEASNQYIEPWDPATSTGEFSSSSSEGGGAAHNHGSTGSSFGTTGYAGGTSTTAYGANTSTAYPYTDYDGTGGTGAAGTGATGSEGTGATSAAGTGASGAPSSNTSDSGGSGSTGAEGTGATGASGTAATGTPSTNTSDAGGTGATGAGGTGATGSSAEANTYRPYAAVGIIATRN